MNSAQRFLIAILILFSVSIRGNAQDTHYWTHQYGTRSTLLGGLVIGSVLDLSGTYYNPGGLSLIKDPETVMAAKIFQYPSITLKGLAGGNVDVASSNLSPAPSLVAGMIKFKWLGKHWLGYSVLTRHEVELGLSGTVIESKDVILDSPGEEEIATDFRLNESLSEPWWGITWSYRVNDHFGIGISQYTIFRSHSVNFQTLAEALTFDGEVAMTIYKRDFRYSNYRMLWKLGLAFDFDRITLGLTFATPSVKLYGSGTSGVNVTVVRQDIDSDGINDDYMATDFQDDLDSNYRTPLSLGIGMTYKFENFRLYGSAEWFCSVDKYEVLSVKDFTVQSTGENLPNKVTHELDSVLNFGIGMEYTFNPNLKTYSSFTTDFSARRPDTDTNLSVTDWNIYHIMGGTTFKILRYSLTVGLGYAFGRRQTVERLDPIPEDLQERLIGVASLYEFNYSSFKFILGFAF
ncbi:MAG: hypothetical protein PVF66_10410 [Candidatus Aminicenantes bacterium]|jgi:hypothetical protein